VADEAVGFVQLVNDQLKTVKDAVAGVEKKLDVVNDKLTELRIAARDLIALEQRTNLAFDGTEATRRELSQLGKDVAVDKAATAAQIAVNETNIKDLTERLKWLSRLVIAALVTGVIGGILAWVFRSFT